jgi:hypothetical protein
MVESPESKAKASWVFEQVFNELALQWTGPEFEFDRDSYKARIQRGALAGRLFYIPVEWLEDSNVSALDVKNRLLAEVRQMEAREG